jgi:hypothetical protein
MTTTTPSSDEILESFNKAALAIAGELDSRKILQAIVDTARTLVNAKYAAIGVPGRHGLLRRFVHSGMKAEEVARIPHLPQGKGLLGAIIEEQKSICIPEMVTRQ